MKLKTILSVVIVLALFSAVVFVARRSDKPRAADVRLGQPLVARTVIEQAAKLQLADQGKTLTLERQPDGTWRDSGYFDLPADFTKLSGFIGSLADAKLQRLVTSNPERIARLEFKDTKIALQDAAGKALWSVTLGKTPETGGGRYVRFGTENKAYIANLGIWLDLDPKNWADAVLLDLKPDDVAKVEIPFDNAAPVTVARGKKDEAWTSGEAPAGHKVKAEKITGLLGSLGNLRFSDTTEVNDPKVAAAKAHQRVFKLTTFANKIYTIALSRKPEEKKLKAPAAGATGGEKKTEAAAAEEKKPADAPKPAETKSVDSKPAEAKPAAPEFETIPAGPVFVLITSSDPAAPVNALMQKRAFEISDYVFTGLPQTSAELFEAAPAAPPEPAKPSEAKKP